MTINDECVVCSKNISTGDIFMKVEIDMRRLIYNEFEGEENFLIPNGPVHATTKLYLCDTCSQDIMMSIPKDLAMALIKSKDVDIHNE